MPYRKTSRTTRSRPPEPQRNSGRRHYVKISEAAEYLGVAPMTVHKMLADGRLTRYQMGNRILRVDLNEIDAMMAAGGGGVA